MKAVIKKALEGYTVSSLKVIAARRNVEFPKKITKAELVKLIVDSGEIESRESVLGKTVQVVVRLV